MPEQECERPNTEERNVDFSALSNSPVLQAPANHFFGLPNKLKAEQLYTKSHNTITSGYSVKLVGHKFKN